MTALAAARPFQASSSVAASFVIGATVLIMVGLQPILLGALTAEGRLTEVELGRVATVEMLLLAVAAALGPRAMARGPMRAKLAGLLLLVGLANLAMAATETTAQIYLLRALAGVCEGLALAACTAIQMDTRQPDRVNALFFGAVGIPQIVGGYSLPVFIIPLWGAAGGYIVLGTMTLAALASVGWTRVPAAGRDLDSGGTWRFRPLVLWLFLAVILQNAGNGAGWTYIERIAVQHSLGTEAVGIAVAAGLGMNVAASFLVAAVGWHLPARPTLVAGLLLHALVCWAVVEVAGSGQFVALAVVFNFFWAALLPFYVKLLVEIDPSRRAALPLSGIGMAGIAIGPFLGSFAVRPGDVGGAFLVAAFTLAAAAAIYAAARGRSTE